MSVSLMMLTGVAQLLGYVCVYALMRMGHHFTGRTLTYLPPLSCCVLGVVDIITISLSIGSAIGSSIAIPNALLGLSPIAGECHRLGQMLEGAFIARGD